MKAIIHEIGFDGNTASDSQFTLHQIDEVEKLECALQHEGHKLTWKDFDDPDEPQTIFQSIVRDRELRVDKKTLMANRPPFAVVTVIDGKVIRLEYYEGHDALSLVFDLRSPEFQDKHMPVFMENDPYAYDPVKFLAEMFGIPAKISRPVLKEIHKKDQS